MNVAVVLCAFLAALRHRAEPQHSCRQDPDVIRAIEKHFPGWAQEKKSSVAIQLSENIPWEKWGQDCRRAIMAAINTHLQLTLWEAECVESLCKSMTEQLEGTTAAALASCPIEFRPRAEALAERRIQYLVEEVLSKGPTTPEARTAIREQIGELAEILKGEARRIVTGSYSEAVLGRTIGSELDSWGEAVEHPLASYLTRPLTQVEYEELAGRIRTRAAALPTFAATTDPGTEETWSPDDLQSGKADTRGAMAACWALIGELSYWQLRCHPKLYGVGVESRELNRRITDWNNRTFADIQTQLREVDNPRCRERVREALARFEADKAAGRYGTGTSVNGSTIPVKPREPIPSNSTPAHPPAPATKWLLGLLILLLATVAVSIPVVLSRKRKPAP